MDDLPGVRYMGDDSVAEGDMVAFLFNPAGADRSDIVNGARRDKHSPIMIAFSVVPKVGLEPTWGSPPNSF